MKTTGSVVAVGFLTATCSLAYTKMPARERPIDIIIRRVFLELCKATEEGDIKKMSSLLETYSGNICHYKPKSQKDLEEARSQQPYDYYAAFFDVNPTSGLENPFHHAAFRRDLPALQLLIQATAKQLINNPIDDLDRRGQTPLELSINQYYQPYIFSDSFQAIIEAGASLAVFRHGELDSTVSTFARMSRISEPQLKRFLEFMLQNGGNAYKPFPERAIRAELQGLLHSDVASIVVSYDDRSGYNQWIHALYHVRPNKSYTNSEPPAFYFLTRDYSDETFELLLKLGGDVDRVLHMKFFENMSLRDMANRPTPQMDEKAIKRINAVPKKAKWVPDWPPPRTAPPPKSLLSRALAIRIW